MDRQTDRQTELLYQYRALGRLGFSSKVSASYNYDNMLSHFHLIPESHGQTDGRRDRQTELLHQYRASGRLGFSSKG